MATVSSPPHVVVLLSTHDGAAHLDQQLESIAAQESVDVSLVARDDGSTDETRSILEDWSKRLPITLLDPSPAGAPFGIFRSFMTLLVAPEAGKADYIAFADQDDVWKPHKLARGAAQLAEAPEGLAALVCTRLEIVDEALTHRGFSPALERAPAFANALVENIATGCSTMMNRKARALVASRPATGAVMHDWWCYLVISAFGQVHWDPEPTVLYRQHRDNAIGSGATASERLQRKLVNQLKGGSRDRLHRQINAFADAFGHSLPPDKQKILDRLVASRDDLGQRLLLVFGKEPWRQSTVDDIAYRVLTLIGRL